MPGGSYDIGSAGRLCGEAHFESCLRLVPCRLDADDVRIRVALRTPCVGCLSRSFFRFYARAPRFISPTTELVEEESARGTIEGRVEEMAGNEQIAARREWYEMGAFFEINLLPKMRAHTRQHGPKK